MQLMRERYRVAICCSVKIQTKNDWLENRKNQNCKFKLRFKPENTLVVLKFKVNSRKERCCFFTECSTARRKQQCKLH